MPHDERSLEQALRLSKAQWQWKVYQMLLDEVVPAGYLIAYGRLAELTNRKYGTSIGARNVANLRRKLYHFQREKEYDVTVPLHRIAKQRDVDAAHDSERTQPEVRRMREQEGSLRSPKWI